MIMKQSQQAGMTLVELLVVIAIIGILAGIGYPSYTRYVVRTKRVDAIANMMELSQWMERLYTERGQYDDDDTHSNNINLPYTRSPKDQGQTQVYALVATNPSSDENTFLITATPQGTQATADSDCGTLSVTHAGVKCINTGGTTSCSNGDATSQAQVAECF